MRRSLEKRHFVRGRAFRGHARNVWTSLSQLSCTVAKFLDTSSQERDAHLRIQWGNDSVVSVISQSFKIGPFPPVYAEKIRSVSHRPLVMKSVVSPGDQQLGLYSSCFKSVLIVQMIYIINNCSQLRAKESVRFKMQYHMQSEHKSNK